MNIKQKYGVEELHFYKLVQVYPSTDGLIYACSSHNFDKDMGAVREQKNGTWRQEPLEGAELKMVLKDLQKDKGKIYFLDTKTYYKTLENLLKYHYVLLSIRQAIYTTQAPTPKDD